ncbi:NAD-dependent epimerase/dehydratase family protein [Brevibacillus sp. NRS-1366]|uniref:NAD-dependent epimerase/dehydratase family protein n=1 Tax=Brevibacillus sp. NRS-1366 TaxID=3233899 RepID=UPI003D228DFE
MKKALVLGGTQFFGKRLVQNLLDADWDVTIATRGKTPDSFGNKVQRLQLDRCDKGTLEAAFSSDDTYWDSVFDQTCYSPIEVKDVIEILAGKIGHYVFTSTMAVYDYGTDKKESDYDPYSYPVEMRSRKEYIGMEGYREAKRQAEAVLFQAAPFSAAAVRFPLVIGPDDYTGRFQFHVDRVKAGEPIGIANLQHRIGFITSEDAGRFLHFAAREKLTGPFNAGSPGDLSLRELLGRIESATRTAASTPIVELTDPQSRSPYDVGGSLSIDVTKAASAGFDFKPMNETITELIDLYIHQNQ